jgi:hypothetical protein
VRHSQLVRWRFVLVTSSGGDLVLLPDGSSSELRPLFRFEGVTDSVEGLWPPLLRSRNPLPLENCRASTSI